jgi:hypothetical protein
LPRKIGRKESCGERFAAAKVSDVLKILPHSSRVFFTIKKIIFEIMPHKGIKRLKYGQIEHLFLIIWLKFSQRHLDFMTNSEKCVFRLCY